MKPVPRAATPTLPAPLSVSSAGSKGVKLADLPLDFLALLTFSILGRIEGGEAGQALRRVGGETVFQYPRPDRRG